MRSLNIQMVGQMQGSIKDLEVESSDEEYEEDENEYVIEQPESKKPAKGGMFSIFKGLVGKDFYDKKIPQYFVCIGT